MRIKRLHLYFLFSICLIIVACAPTKRLKEGEVFLKKQRITLVDPPKEFSIENEDLRGVLKQRVNRKILFFRFHLGVYNLVNPKQQERAHQRKAKRKQAKIERKRNNGKSISDEQFEAWKADTLTWRDWLTNTVGEAPVVLDSSETQRSANQIGIFLKKHGYFKSDVRYDISLNRKGNKAKVNYLVLPDSAYRIADVRFRFDDENILSRDEYLMNSTKLKTGDVFDIDELDDERDRIQKYLNNRGYYTFSKDYIVYRADSTIGNRRVDVEMIVKPLRTDRSEEGDSLVLTPHPKFFMGDITFYTSYDPARVNAIPSDTLVVDGVTFLSNGELQIKPDLLLYLLSFQNGDMYQKERVDQTYRKLSQLAMFRSVNIQMVQQKRDDVNVLDCRIYLAPARQYAFSAESGVTHRDGLFGLSGSLVFRNRNVFNRSENGEFRIIGAVEAQQPLTSVESLGDVAQDVSENIRFNTFEIGPQITLNFNHWFPLGLSKFKKSNEPKSSLSLAFNYQNRPDYERQLYQLRYGVNFIENRSSGSRIYGFAELSTIKIDKSAAFDELLNSLSDDFLSNSYQNHLIASLRGVWEINTQKPGFQRRYKFNRFSAEMAGLMTRLGFNLAEQLGWSRAVRDEQGSYQIGGIRFAEYLKFDNDFRWYFRWDEKNITAFRILGGVGIPLANLNVLPFEKSYFAGGSNGIRAWDPRTLGPGSYRDSTSQVTFNNIGELRLEASAEYRFKLTETFEGALFVDAGNIWFLESDEDRPGSVFNVSDIYDQLAIGAGVGFRFDFDFFLLRFDVAMQVKDPAKINGEQWFWEPKDEYNSYLETVFPGQNVSYSPVLNYNLGIGYPF